MSADIILSMWFIATGIVFSDNMCTHTTPTVTWRGKASI